MLLLLLFVNMVIDKGFLFIINIIMMKIELCGGIHFKVKV